jgi:NAD(P)-dependent dehydrogenase (short-subunit alcohol dehydrogenase family)
LQAGFQFEVVAREPLRAAGVQEDHGLPLEGAGFAQSDQALQRLAGVDRVEQQPLGPGRQGERIDNALIDQAIARADIVAVGHHHVAGDAVAVAQQLGTFSINVNAAGVALSAPPMASLDGTPHDMQTFRDMLELHLFGPFNVSRLCAAAFAANTPDEDGQRGAIVNTASVAAYEGQIGQAAYSASKGGVVGMTITIARDLAAAGIRVNTIAPGLIDTPIYGSGEASEAFKENLQKGVLFPKRLGTGEEFATLALELLTNSYMNAVDIRVDGGIRMPPK